MNEPINIQLVIGLKPEQISEYYKRKGYKLTWNWEELWQKSHTKAFTVAKAMKLDILSDIRNEVQKAIDEGISFQQFKENLKPILKSKGWWGKVKAKDVPSDIKLPDGIDPEKEIQLGSPYRLKTIYRTNLNVAYAAGHYKAMTDNINDRPYWKYDATLDSRTRPSHRALHGKVFRADDPIWDKIYPPNGWNCRCSVIPLDDADLKELGLKPESVTLSDGNIPKGFKSEKEWQYNPGKSFLEFDNNFGNFSQYKNQTDYTHYKRPSIKELPEDNFLDIPELLPPIKKVGMESFEKQIKKLFNINKDGFSLINTKDDDKALFTLNRLKHFYEKQDGREQFAPLVIKTLQNPFEVYQTIYKSDKDFLEFRKTYFGLFKDNKKRPFFIVLKMEKDSTVFWNAIPYKLSDIDKLRKGILIYKK